jgi:hypothetical protein
VDDLKNKVKWFKIPSDPALPTRRKELIYIYKQTKLRTTRGTILPDADPIPAASVPALQALMNPMALGLASLMNPMTLDLASAIGSAVIAPAPVLAPTVAADVAPAATAGVTLSANGKQKKMK